MVDFVSDGPLFLLLVLNQGFLVHQPLQNLLPHFTLLIEEGEKLVPGDGILDESLGDAFLDVGGRASLQ